MQSPHSPPPIPTPDGQRHYSPSMVRGDWKSAPVVVRGWAYPLTWLVLIVLPLAILGSAFGEGQSSDVGERIFLAVFLSVVWAINLWHNRNLKSGASVAWTTQIVLSCLGLLAFPLGMAIHAYILSQWYKPEVKGWFGRS